LTNAAIREQAFKVRPAERALVPNAEWFQNAAGVILAQ
jgi:hypothetical protein